MTDSQLWQNLQESLAYLRAEKLPLKAGHDGGVGQLLVQGDQAEGLQERGGLHGPLLSDRRPLQGEGETPHSDRAGLSYVVCCSAHLVLLQPGGPPGGQGGGVAAHTGPVAGDRGSHSPAGQEDELQGPQTSHHQSHSVAPPRPGKTVLSYKT